VVNNKCCGLEKIVKNPNYAPPEVQKLMHDNINLWKEKPE
jgi:hypothetical protein